MREKSAYLLIGLFLAVSGSLMAFDGGGIGGIHLECTVNSNPAYNSGHCRVASDGTGEICYPDGTGPACHQTTVSPQ